MSVGRFGIRAIAANPLCDMVTIARILAVRFGEMGFQCGVFSRTTV